jgi:hypothetical protein
LKSLRTTSLDTLYRASAPHRRSGDGSSGLRVAAGGATPPFAEQRKTPIVLRAAWHVARLDQSGSDPTWAGRLCGYRMRDVTSRFAPRNGSRDRAGSTHPRPLPGRA